jgi:hypothetical protein
MNFFVSTLLLLSLELVRLDFDGVPLRKTGPPLTDFFIVVVVLFVFEIYFFEGVGGDLLLCN